MVIRLQTVEPLRILSRENVKLCDIVISPEGNGSGEHTESEGLRYVCLHLNNLSLCESVVCCIGEVPNARAYYLLHLAGYQ